MITKPVSNMTRGGYQKMGNALCGLIISTALAALPVAAHAVIWGLNCTPNAPQCSSTAQTVTGAQWLHAGIYRVRVGVPHPIADGCYPSISAAIAAGAHVTVVSGNVDPIVDGVDVPIQSTTGFAVGDPVTMDALPAYPSCATITGKAGSTITVSTAVSQYINSSTNNGVLGAGNLYPAMAAAGIPIELNIFNSGNGKASEAPEIGCTSSTSCPSGSQWYRDAVTYMLDTQIAAAGLTAPVLISVGNEQNGGSSSSCNGVSGVPQSSCPVSLAWTGNTAYDAGPTPWWYFPLLHDTITVANAHGIATAGSGITTMGIEVSYWYTLETGCTVGVCGNCTTLLSCQIEADKYQQTSFVKSLGQAKLSTNLSTVCNPVTPLLSPNQTNIYSRTLGILQDEATAGVTYTNFHNYALDWTSEGPALLWAASVSGKQPMIGEWAPYSLSAYDMVREAQTCVMINAAYCEEWNQESVGNYPAARALLNVDGTLRPSALWYLAYIGVTGPAYIGGPTIPPIPNLMTGPPPAQPFHC